MPNTFWMHVILPIYLCNVFLLFSVAKRRKWFWPLAVLGLIIEAAICGYFPYTTPSPDATGILPILSMGGFYLTCYAFSFAWTFVLYELHVTSATVTTVISVSTQRLAACLVAVIFYFVPGDIQTLSWLSAISTIATLSVFCGIAFLLWRIINKAATIIDPSLELVALALIGLFSTTFINFIILTEQRTKNFNLAFDILNGLVCFLIIYSFFNSTVRAKAKNELRVMEKMLDEQAKQYQISKDIIDMINIKCHDIRHQIKNIASNKETISEEELCEINKDIRVFETRIKSGNPSLDIVLQEKLLLCMKDNIHFDIMVSAEKMAFITESDIYSLFGNLLENAIEASKKIEDINKREIRIRIKEELGLLLVDVSNNYQGQIKMEEGNPVTSKGNKSFHGFGTKSIKYIVHKYGGNLIINTDDLIYKVTIAFPIDN